MQRVFLGIFIIVSYHKPLLFKWSLGWKILDGLERQGLIRSLWKA